MACIIALQAGHHLGEIAAAAVGVGAARRQFLHVVAGGIRRAGGRDHYRAHFWLVVNLFQRRVQLRDHRFRQTVARRGAIERQHGNAADALAQQNRSLRRWRACGPGGHGIIHLGSACILM